MPSYRAPAALAYPGASTVVDGDGITIAECPDAATSAGLVTLLNATPVIALMRASLAHHERHLAAAEALGKTQAAEARRRSIARIAAMLREAGENA